MSYPKQDSVNRRLHEETISALHDMRESETIKLSRVWGQYRRHLQLAIMDAYHGAVSSGKWNLSAFKARSEARLLNETRSILAQFRSVAVATMKSSLNHIYRQSVLRHAWILDQVTPEGRTVSIPHRQALHESAVTVFYQGANGSEKWKGSLDLWINGYYQALNHNLAMGAMNENGIDEAVKEVDATKANTPAYGIWNAMARIYDYEATSAMAEGTAEVADANADLVEEEIWRTRGDLAVCDDCDANEGLTMEEADGDIPLHPNCHCYPQIVPKAFADLLSSGDPEDKELAYDLDYRGLVPNSLVIRNPSGDITAKTIVNFEDWAQGNHIAVTAQ